MLALLITLFLSPPPSQADVTSLVHETARLLVRWDQGGATILRVERQPLAAPDRLRRWRGRFEARAVAAGKTLDFVRFDFPLMAEAESTEDATAEARALGKKIREHVTATTYVRVPLPAGASGVAIYDSVTKRSTSADLPPPSPPPPAAGGGGSTRR